MVNYIAVLVFVILLLVGGAVVAPLATVNPVLAVVVGIVWLIADAIISSAIQVATQWQRAVVFRVGKFKDIRGPGLFFIIPVIEQVRMLDTRVLAVHIPKQQVITRDNVPVTIDATHAVQLPGADPRAHVSKHGHRKLCRSLLLP